jgi:hypothetical protein
VRISSEFPGQARLAGCRRINPETTDGETFESRGGRATVKERDPAKLDGTGLASSLPPKF